MRFLKFQESHFFPKLETFNLTIEKDFSNLHLLVGFDFLFIARKEFDMSCMIMSDNAFYQIAKFLESNSRFLDKELVPSFCDGKATALEMANAMKRMNYEAFKTRYNEGYTEDEVIVDMSLCEDYCSVDYPRLIVTMQGFTYQCDEGDDIPADVDTIYALSKYLSEHLTKEERDIVTGYDCKWY